MKAADILVLMQVLIPIIEQGITTIPKIRQFLRSEGATDAQLAELDVRLSAEIQRREAEASAQ